MPRSERSSSRKRRAQSARADSTAPHERVPSATTPVPLSSSERDARWLVVALSTLALALVGSVGWHLRKPPRPAAQRVVRVERERPAQPGEIDREHRELECPVPPVIDRCANPDDPWRFPGVALDGVRAQFDAVGFAPALRDELLARTRCDAEGCITTPTDAQLEALPADARGRNYRALAPQQGSHYAMVPFRRPLRFGAWEDLPGLPPSVRSLLQRTTWRENDTEYFADIALACHTFTDVATRHALIDALDRRYSVDVTIRVGPNTPLDEVVRYWSAARPEREVRVLFEAAQRNGTRVALPDLMPPMPRHRIDTFPAPGEPAYDCFWSSLHFFDPNPERFAPPTPEVFSAELAAHWREIPEADRRFGDMLVLYTNGTPTHAMIHVAEDLAFTKNGRYPRRPWIVMSVHDVRRDYTGSGPVRVYRNVDTR